MAELEEENRVYRQEKIYKSLLLLLQGIIPFQTHIRAMTSARKHTFSLLRMLLIASAQTISPFCIIVGGSQSHFSVSISTTSPTNKDFQGLGKGHLLSYVESSTGPTSQAVWTVQCKGIPRPVLTSIILNTGFS
jgi:hypothetical protein